MQTSLSIIEINHKYLFQGVAQIAMSGVGFGVMYMAPIISIIGHRDGQSILIGLSMCGASMAQVTARKWTALKTRLDSIHPAEDILPPGTSCSLIFQMGSGHLFAFLLEEFNWRGAYIIPAVLSLLSGVIGWFGLVEPPQQEEQQLETHRTSWRTVFEAVCCVIGDTCAVAGLYVPYTCFPAVLSRAGRWYQTITINQ